ncbi:MBL fold metallo-hydrolase [Flavitalea sp.]|nr:MBL fold metallo-hydrolase [Flavitalea sp.]
MARKSVRILKRILIVFFSIIMLFIIATFFYMRQDKFGQLAEGNRLERIKKSPNYHDGKFQNIHHTPQITEGYSYTEVLYEFIFKHTKRRKPDDKIPSMKTDLLHLSPDQDILVWFGHSSYFIQLDGKRILADPVFSGDASPVPGANKAFAGTDRYTTDDLPPIDYIFISHDHYDHVDYTTLLKLISKTGKIFCGLGVGAHLELWGFRPEQVIESDWNEEIRLDSGFVVHTTPARHFSGRGLSANKSLWLSYVLASRTMKIYIGGDSGYDTHFADIGKKFGPIDLAVLENGQYDIKWRYIHLLPGEVIKAAKDLKAKRLFPVHSSKFAMANHAWDEPLIKVSELNKQSNIPLVTPIIGELVNLKDSTQVFSQWWVGIK